MRLSPSTLLLMVLTSSFLASMNSAQGSGGQCAKVWSQSSPGTFLNNRSPGAQRFLRLIQSSMRDRFLETPEIQQLISELYENGPAGRQTVKFDWPQMSGQISKSRRDNTLVFSIPVLVVREDGNSLSYGKRPRGLRLDFPKILVAIAEVSRWEIMRDPQIQKVEMVAISVVNRDLVNLLKESGFVMQASYNHSPYMPPGLDHFSPSPFGPGALGISRRFPPMDGVPSGAFGRSSLDNPNAELGRSWTLIFDVKRP